jgi:hypothetical protein
VSRTLPGIRETLARPDLGSCKRATVIFLTDGKGESDTPGLFAAFERHVADVWGGKQLIVHTVGFSSDHEFAFLDTLRTKGTDVGVFQFADPNEDDDALFHKLTALAAPILRGGSAKAILSIPETPVKVEVCLVAGRGQLWVDAADARSIAQNYNGSSTGTALAKVTTGGAVVHVDATLRCTNNYGLWMRWYSRLTDVLLQHVSRKEGWCLLKSLGLGDMSDAIKAFLNYNRRGFLAHSVWPIPCSI